MLIVCNCDALFIKKKRIVPNFRNRDLWLFRF